MSDDTLFGYPIVWIESEDEMPKILVCDYSLDGGYILPPNLTDEERQEGLRLIDAIEDELAE